MENTELENKIELLSKELELCKQKNIELERKIQFNFELILSRINQEILGCHQQIHSLEQRLKY